MDTPLLRKIKIVTFSAILLVAASIIYACSGSISPEASQTSKLLGVRLEEFPKPQGVTGFDAIPSIQPQFKYSLVSAPFVPPKPSDWFEGRSSVYASAPDGTVWEAYCGRAGAAPAVDPAVDFQPNALTRP
jgi:hypothetical protein